MKSPAGQKGHLKPLWEQLCSLHCSGCWGWYWPWFQHPGSAGWQRASSYHSYCPLHWQAQKFPPWASCKLLTVRTGSKNQRVTSHQLHWKALRGTVYTHSAGCSFCSTGLLQGLLVLSILLLPALLLDTASLQVPLLPPLPRSSAEAKQAMEIKPPSACFRQEHRGFVHIFVAAPSTSAGQQEMTECFTGRKGRSVANLKLSA